MTGDRLAAVATLAREPAFKSRRVGGATKRPAVNRVVVVGRMSLPALGKYPSLGSVWEGEKGNAAVASGVAVR